MNLPSLITTLLFVASSATTVVFADDLGLDSIPGIRTGSGHGDADPCTGEADDGSTGAADGNSTDNSTDSSSNTTSSSGNTTSSSGNTTSEGNTTSDGNQTSSSSTSSSDNSTSSSETSIEPSADDCPPAGTDDNETAPDQGNETATDDNETAEPEPVPAASEPQAACFVAVDDWGNDIAGGHHEWEWYVSPGTRSVGVSFEGYGGLPTGLASHSSARLIDGSGRTIASSSGGDSHIEAYLEHGSDFLAPGNWRLVYDSSDALTDYSAHVGLNCGQP